MFIKITSPFSQLDNLHILIHVPHVKAYVKKQTKNLERGQAPPKKKCSISWTGTRWGVRLNRWLSRFERTNWHLRWISMRCHEEQQRGGEGRRATWARLGRQGTRQQGADFADENVQQVQWVDNKSMCRLNFLHNFLWSHLGVTASTVVRKITSWERTKTKIEELSSSVKLEQMFRCLHPRRLI